MKWGAFLTASLLLFAVILPAVSFSHHGLLDVFRFRKKIMEARAKVALVEEENRLLKRQVDLLNDPSQEVVERHLRLYFGWAKPGEWVYFEPSVASARK